MPAPIYTYDNTCPADGIGKEWWSSWTIAFVILFVWRYLRQVVHLVSFWMYRPAEPLTIPTITSRDATVIVPTIDPNNAHFQTGIVSAARNLPSKIVVVTAGEALRRETLSCSGVAIEVLAAAEANKRVQTVTGARRATTKICVLMDDHVLWKDTFLEYALPAFDRDPKVGIVGTNKRVTRDEEHGSLHHRILSMVQCLYLERHNFEIRSSNAVDGGVFVVSGRTSLVRTSILQDPNFLRGFLNDYFLFGLVGPLAVDDDNFITRWCIAHGWRVKIQYRPETLITTSLGSAAKFTGGLKRWVRTTWRSNSTSLTSLHVWYTQPWSVYAVYLSLFTNFALFYDPLLLYAFAQSDLSGYRANGPVNPIGYNVDGTIDHGRVGDSSITVPSTSLLFSLLPLLVWMFAFKMVKPFAYFWRHPGDLKLLWAYILFTYVHSLIKLNGLLTFYSAKWEGRNLASLHADLAKKQTHQAYQTQHPLDVPATPSTEETVFPSAPSRTGTPFTDTNVHVHVGPDHGFSTAVEVQRHTEIHVNPPAATTTVVSESSSENTRRPDLVPAQSPVANPFAVTDSGFVTCILGDMYFDESDSASDQ
ncbi:hypothetical protein SPBR_02596 [Sporothrix brasiliensis 5110]|uniref:Capsule polysaccharide synthase Cps1 n=1 Tax=Sporothrix brasiliensis 5110 TaxID=1398154 RepID=A0A0C2ISQ3_9PEZI|nr:uncharacterized protein SPBR_02596 [Sporothrix brasiliensis 5110]KIH92081.1 hypothetical protein SPBR_02596 [Sporothrix brasiliensis 5110]